MSDSIRKCKHVIPEQNYHTIIQPKLYEKKKKEIGKLVKKKKNVKHR